VAELMRLAEDEDPAFGAGDQFGVPAGGA